MASLADLLVKVGIDAGPFLQGLSEVSQSLKETQKEMAGIERAMSGFTKMGERLQSLGAVLTGALTVPLVGGAAAATVVAGKFEQVDIAFTNMLGSAARAKTLLGELQQFAATTPFEFPDLVEAAKRMLAMGFEADKLLPTLRIIGDAVSGIGGGSAEINRVTLALGQMQAKGKVSAQEMNQLAELGIPAWKFLADQIGVTIPQAMKLAEKGAIEAQLAIPAILAGMNQKFHGMMDDQSKTLLGMWSNLKDQFTLMLTDVGNAAIPTMKSILASFQPVIEGVRALVSTFKDLPQPVQTTIFAVAGLAAAAGPLLVAFGGLLAAIPSITAGAAALGITTLPALGAALGPVAIGVAALAAAWAAWKYQDDILGIQLLKAVLGTVWEATKFFVGALQDLYTWAKSASDSLGMLKPALDVMLAPINFLIGGYSGLTAALKGYNDNLGTSQSIWAQAAAFMSESWTGVKNTVSALWTDLSGLANSVFGGIFDYLTSVWTSTFNLATTIWGGITAFMGTAFGNLGTAWTVTWGALSEYLSGVWGAIKGFADSIWQAIVDKVNWAIGALGKLLPETTKALKEWADQAGKASTQTKDLGDKSQAAKTKVDDLTKKVTDVGKANKTAAEWAELLAGKTDKVKKEHQETYKPVQNHSIETLLLAERMRRLNNEQTDLVKKVVDYRLAVENSKTKTVDWDAELGKLSNSMNKVDSAVGNVAKIQIPSMVQALLTVRGPQDEFIASLEKLGIKSTESYQKAAAEAKKAYDVIVGNPNATTFEKNSALLKVLEAQMAAAKANNEQIPASQLDLYQKLKAQTDTKIPELTKGWKEFGNEVSTIISNTAQSMAKSLFDGDLSFGQKGIDMLKSLGEAVVAKFIEPATKAIANFVTGVLSDLLGGKGFGGLIDSAKKLGDTLSDVFSGGAGAAGSTAGSVGGAAGSVGGSAGSAAGAATSSVAAWVGAIGAVAGAIGSIGSFIMGIRQEGTMNAVEENTRFAQIHLKEILERGVNMFMSQLPGIRDMQVQFMQNDAWRIHDVWGRLGDLVDVIRFDTNPTLWGIQNALVEGGGRQLVVNLNNPTFANRSDIDYAVQQIGRNLR